MGIELELIAQDTEAVRTAIAIGADRVELCQALALGGLTPSPGLIECAVDTAGAAVEVHALIRCRAGGFRYADDEVDVMAADVRGAIRAGAHGVVVGCLNERGRFDEAQMRRLRDAALAERADAGFSAHRAIDVAADPIAALEQLVTLGVGRVLTSGASADAGTGAPMLARMVTAAAGRISIMTGGGITDESIPPVIAAGVDAVHFSAKRLVIDAAGRDMGAASDSYERVDAALAHTLAGVARAAPRSM